MEALTQPSDWALYLTPRPGTPHQFDVGVRTVGTVFKHRARRINAVAHTKNKQALNFTPAPSGLPVVRLMNARAAAPSIRPADMSLCTANDPEQKVRRAKYGPPRKPRTGVYPSIP